MKLKMIFLVLIFSFGAFAQNQTKWITIGSDAIPALSKSIHSGVMLHAQSNNISLLQVRTDKMLDISEVMHTTFHRCAGFMMHDSLEEAQLAMTATPDKIWAINGMFTNYSINQKSRVDEMIALVQEPMIRATITQLSSFNNRYYKAQTGVDSQNWLMAYWSKIAESRSDITVEMYKHSKWPQPSVVATVLGSHYPNEIVVVGGHADSINGQSFSGKERARAPGADDNASGIASITEALRILVLTGYRPERTIQFMGYAAEEVGLLGSQEIAREYKSRSYDVVGVLQLDMTNFKGTPDKDIVMMSDFTNQKQNEFIGSLIDTYIKLPWGYSRCGYGCSDHASWTANGYPSSIPFEANMNDMNHKIHTTEDTIARSGGHAAHAQKFAKLAVAYMVELAK